METYFMGKGHRERFLRLMADDGTARGDTERISLFYIISGNEGLYSRRKDIYDFDRHMARHCMGAGLSSSMSALLRLGLNLYNGYRDGQTAPLELFWNLDSGSRLLAYRAIRLRFNDI